MAILQVTKMNATVVNLPDPAQLTYNIMDIDGSSAGRSLGGTMIRDRVAVKRKIDVAWPPLDNTQISAILSAIEDYKFTLSFPDAKSGTTATMTCYVGDRTAPAYRFVTGAWLWSGLSCSFVEV